MATRIYRMTIASTWYDAGVGMAQEYELHFKAVRGGDIRSNREALAKRGTPIFQNRVYKRTGRWIPKRKVKVRFEREEPTNIAPEDVIQVEARSIDRIGKRWNAHLLPFRVLSYEKQSRV